MLKARAAPVLSLDKGRRVPLPSAGFAKPAVTMRRDARADQLPLTEVVRVLSELRDAKLGNGVHVHEMRVQPQRCRSPEVQGHDADDQPADARSRGPRRAASAWPSRSASAACPRPRRHRRRRRTSGPRPVSRSARRAATARIRSPARTARVRRFGSRCTRRLWRPSPAARREPPRRDDGDQSDARLQPRGRAPTAWLSAPWRLRRSARCARRLRSTSRCAGWIRRSAWCARRLRSTSRPARRLRSDGRRPDGRRPDGRRPDGRWPDGRSARRRDDPMGGGGQGRYGALPAAATVAPPIR